MFGTANILWSSSQNSVQGLFCKFVFHIPQIDLSNWFNLKI